MFFSLHHYNGSLESRYQDIVKEFGTRALPAKRFRTLVNHLRAFETVGRSGSCNVPYLDTTDYTPKYRFLERAIFGPSRKLFVNEHTWLVLDDELVASRSDSVEVGATWPCRVIPNRIF